MAKFSLFIFFVCSCGFSSRFLINFLYFYQPISQVILNFVTVLLIAKLKGRQAEPHILASGIAHGRVRTTAATATTESCKMAAILQIIGWQRHAALVYHVLLWHWTSMLWSIDNCENKVSADQYPVTISRAQVYNSLKSRVFWSWPLTKCWFFDWMAGVCQVNLL